MNSNVQANTDDNRIEQVYQVAESDQKMVVGGIPLNKIKELVSEAISAAEHHKRTLKSKRNSTSQRKNGPINNVIWDDDKHRAQSQHAPRIIGPIYSPIAQASKLSQTTLKPKTSKRNKKRLSGLLQKGFFGDMTRKIEQQKTL